MIKLDSRVGFMKFCGIVFLLSATLFVFGSGCAKTAQTEEVSGKNVGEIPIAILPASSDLGVGENRFAFGLLGSDNMLVEHAEVMVWFSQIKQTESMRLPSVRAHYRAVDIPTSHIHDDGQIHEHIEITGAYVVDTVNFDISGQWNIEAVVKLVDDPDLIHLHMDFMVRDTTFSPRIGDPAPPSQNRTAADVGELLELSTRRPPFGAMHQMSIHNALEERRPIVVIFATPAFCRSRLCGPVLDVVGTLLPAFSNQVEFIHIEPYSLSVLRDEGRFVLSDTAAEWGVLTEPFVFVVDSQGLVIAKFEGIVTAKEIQVVLRSIIGS